MAFLDPQERMWEGKSGKYFKLADVRTKVDTVSPFNKVCDLTTDPYCHGTIFRFPLRKVSSSLSNQCYDMAKIQQLFQALREEGKLLLIFLRSIESIEVHEINIDGTVSLKFSVCISKDKERIRQIRGTFMQRIEQAYKQSRYNIKDCIPMSVDFHVELNREGSLTSHHWLVVSHVGSENQSVLQQAASQHVFPWVGMALELSNLAQINASDWKNFLQPFLNVFLRESVVWTENLESSGAWIRLNEATVVPKGTELAQLIHTVLTKCELRIVQAPENVHAGIQASGFNTNYLSHSVARAAMKRFPASYTTLDRNKKLKVLEYCLSDGQYGDLVGLQLIPLADNTFAQFWAHVRGARLMQTIYICSEQFPRHLFLNADSIVVSLDDQNLMRSIQKVGDSRLTQLQTLDLNTVVQLIKQRSFPSEWQSMNTAEVISPNHKEWYTTFWQWVQPHSLSYFNNDMIIPLSTPGPQGGLRVTRLSTHSPILHLTNSDQCSAELMSFISKMPVHVSQTSMHPFLDHKELYSYVKRLNPEGLVNALVLGCCGKYNQLNSISLTESEAQHVSQYLGGLSSMMFEQQRSSVLINLPIFTTVNKSGLYSVAKANECSWNSRAIILPDNCEISDENLPSNIVFLSSLIQQRSLINKLSLHMKAPTTIEFVLDTLFVMVKQGTFNPASKLDDIMVEILTLLPSWMRKWPKQMNTVTSALQTLPFLPTGAGRKSPSQLYDSGQPELVALFQGEHVFPLAPFDTDMLVQLRQCGLILLATINVLVGVVRTIGPPASSGNPQQVTPVRYNRAKAVIRYLSRFTPADVASFFQQVSNISWIPVQSNPPTMLNSAVDMYPQCIPWKGKPYVCHFVSLGSHVFVPTPATAEYPFILGSQVYVADCVLQVSKPDNILPNSSSYVSQVLAHFKEVIAHSVECEPTERLLHLIYDYLNANCLQIGVDTFKTFPPWIWLTYERAFVSPSVVAMKPNPSFPQDLSPYVYTLNDRFGVQYQPLFVRSGVGLEVVSRQIASVLGMMSRMGTRMMTADKAWQIVMSILNWLTNNGEKPIKEFDDVKLYIPVESEEEYPVLKQICDNVVYNDNDFLEGVLARSGQEYSYTLINHRVSPRMASCLGLAALSKHLDISEETFEDVGQCEPLTVRLRNILRDYKDGLTIIKELIQNADDAEATEINICYDTRTHCEDQRSLFFPHMSETHGPALVVHNNAVFTDDDFQNITKLAGATKENKQLKIGKFGIGFCSVYHMTDVPSFVSREFLYIFDPMLKYLGDAVKNRSRPGKKLSFTHRILKHSKQMDPFRDLYDFNPSQEYKGTIFRLPFRKNSSDISSTVYDSHTVMELLGNLEKHSNEIILFLRHIQCITFSRFDNGSKCPTVLCKIEKRSLCTFPGTRALMCNVTNANIVGTESSNTWLIATTEKHITSKYATSSVACSLKHCNGKYQVCSCEGGSFCFLPLAKTTGLPVHISSNFAVSNNRRGIWTDDGSQGVPALEAQWNVELMTTTIPEAYCLLLETLKEMHLKDQLSEYIYCALWPSTERLHEKNPWSKSVDCIYKIIALKELFYSSAISKWLTLGQSKFLSNNILSTSISQQETEKCVLIVVKQLCLPVVDLPFQYHVHLDLENFMITEANFVEIFFKNINSLSHMVDTRNSVLLKILELYTIEVGKTRQNNISPFLKNYPCIPCTPDGTVLKKASEIIDPQSVFAKMYDNSEHMVPISMFDGNTLAKASMHALGLHKDSVPWKFIIQRATGIQSYLQIDRKKALQRVDCILQSIKKNISSNPDGLSDESKSLATIPFLPVKSKPNEYPLQWCGEGHDLGCGKELVLSGAEVKEVTVQRNELLSGSQVKILKLKFKNESETLPDNVIDLLQIKREPLCNDVIAHFKCLTQLVEKGLLQSRIVQSMCRSIYGYFEIQIKDSKGYLPAEMETLKHSYCILVKDGFVSSEFVSQEWSLDGPYLFKVPNVLTTRKLFAEFAGIKQSFGPETVFKALQRMKDDFNGKPVPENCQYIISKIIPVLTDSVKDKPACCVVLPDANYTLHDACNLVYNDTPWCPYDQEQTIFVHENIPRHLAQKLGVKTVRSQRVERYASANEVHFLGAEFGQHEELTQRIQNIIRDYPFDETIIKELLQNADDAEAKTMYFILDKRTHKTDRILSENWKELQGPALLVWNNSVFSERDLEGIQKLGLGSKRSDTEKIGQYGIGFNAVYHLTDCPSFISGGETLCILDPHCRYAPGANALKPGRRFDHLSTGFWSDFQDMRSAYLHTETQSFPDFMQANLREGSLFRFPIRHCEELVSLSKIIPKHDEKERSSRPLRANSLQDLLNAWSPCVKKSMLFLNNINAITFCTVEQNGRFNILHHFETHISTDGRQKCAELHKRVHQFNSVTTNTSCTVNYELEVLETIGKKERPKERWLVQQGIGDSMNDEQEWQYIRQVKPRHGIAFPLSSVAEFKSLVFCFLPLPVESHLPVLINGHFILHSNRRELWASTNPDCPDQKSTWNKRLISAIASSYASLLTDGGKKVIQRCEGRTREQVEADIKMYYNIFPDIHSEKLKGLWKELAEDVYKILSDKNAAILANVREMKPALLLPDDNEPLCTLNVKWCRLKDDAKKSEQVHFFTTAMENTANSKLWTHMHWNVFEAIGMTLTSAPIRIMDHFRHAGSDIPMTTPVVVFDYYASFNAQVLPGSHPTFPCHLEDTKFKTIDNIKIFLKYLRVKKDGIYEYVKAPYGVPLLLTADGNIRMNDENGKVVVSEYSALFPCSLHRFLHPDLIDLDLIHRVFGEGIEDKDISILVKPCQVVTNMKEKNFYPFLHQLPIALYGFLELLECIGVKKEIDASHMRTVLEMAFQASKNEPLDVNTNKIVATAIKSLYNNLKECKGVDQNIIKPLYLPDHLNRLCESTTLVYVDDPQYRGAIFNFSDTELSEVDINLDETPHMKFLNTLDFCSALPESVKPVRLSLCTTMQIHSEPVENQCPLAIQLQTILRMHKVFKAISTIVRHCTHDEALSKQCYDSLVAKASIIEVRTVQRLRYDVVATKSQKTLGSKNVKYAYDERNCKLYIESSAQVTQIAHDSIFSRLSSFFMDHIESILQKSMPEEHLKQLSKFLPMLLNVPNEEGVDEALNEVYSLEVDYDETELRSLDPRHGEAIPLNWHHRLDQDVHNIFTYLEWVGFEKEEGKIVFAQVIHRVSQDSDDPYKTKYVIRISQDDMIGIEVSALDLYKFLRGDKTPVIELSESKEIVLRQVVENDDTSNTAATNHASAEKQLGLQEILKQLCAELGNIWRLPEDDRRKAVKRLYLKWHPDKNPDQVQLAEQVFKFLKRQVDRLETGLPLEDPTTQNPSKNTASSTQQGHSNFWQAYYNHWDETVHNHQRSWHNEHKYRRRNRHRGYGGGGGGRSYDFWSQPTWHPTPNREEGCKWLQQAEADMEVLQILYNATDTTRSACSYVCFLAYEVVCKALKGGLYLKCGLSSQDRVQRSVVLLANTLEAEVRSCRGMLLVHANVVKDYEESTRFPHLCQGEAIPARYFGCEQASEARKSALAVLNAVKEFMTL
eukprot:Em0006g1368a